LTPRTIDLVGEVIDSVPPRRLVLSWAEPADGPSRAKHTRVAIEIERVENMVRLTVTHDEFQLGSDMLQDFEWLAACAVQSEILPRGWAAAENLGLENA
jgi:uncharacterized protein YndB with AHSA1/START domain